MISAEPAACKPFSPGLPKLLGSFGPATHGLRTSTKNESSLATRFGQVKKPVSRRQFCKGFLQKEKSESRAAA
jgi:hypothetical protein